LDDKIVAGNASKVGDVAKRYVNGDGRQPATDASAPDVSAQGGSITSLRQQK
jgi:hypothetical protein